MPNNLITIKQNHKVTVLQPNKTTKHTKNSEPNNKSSNPKYAPPQAERCRPKPVDIYNATGHLKSQLWVNQVRNVSEDRLVPTIDKDYTLAIHTQACIVLKSSQKGAKAEISLRSYLHIFP